RGQLAEQRRPLQWIVERLPDARRWLRAVSQTVAGHEWLGERAASLEQLEQMLTYLEQSPRLTRHGLVPLLREGSDRESEYRQGLRQVAACRWTLNEAEDSTRHWREKLSASDTAAALEQARRFESAWWAPLHPAWWSLRGVLAKSYNFAAHRIRPRWSQVLEELQAEHLAARAVRDAETAVCQSLGYGGSLEELEDEVRALRERVEVLPPAARALHQRLLDADESQATVEVLLRLVEPARRLRGGLDELLADYGELTWAELEAYLDELEPALEQLPDYFYLLNQFGPLPDALLAALRSLPLRAEQWEAAVTDQCVRQALAREPGLRQFNAGLRARQARQLGQSFERWQRHNAVAVEQAVCGRFVEQVRQADNTSSRASAAERQRRKRYTQGRRELEHEFGKSMRYKSIRDLVAGDSGLVIRDLKPVWLMSPLSVSDALPLDTELFDVVIFDEASQITLEEAIPSLFRARQTIVVGDEMQLPPTDFFSSRQSDDEDPLELDEQGEVLQYDLSCNSFLNHSARNLPSCVLGWHYRSRSESLISFSNWAFYQGRLLTVPEEQLLQSGSDEIVVESAADAERHGRSLLARPVSFHLLPHAVYDQRRNRAEAEYIAGLVRQLLQDPRRLTLGVVAFSEAQQQEIEAALERLARDDGAFRERLEAEFEREEDGQFVGLLVKNLENIQGDERDVILLSVCYGHGPDGRMRMNFGPINKSGGEKRLNVAFSRARHHMAVISSIRDHHITNEFNDGARCLRDYLRYAAALSRGDRDA
ncbi:MAG: DNA2/NAM7 family helicase, partial [Pirellulaceae bacterium]|nr:DNA2/NAM7 family helicase [Pirellulaceae bacterium]